MNPRVPGGSSNLKIRICGCGAKKYVMRVTESITPTFKETADSRGEQAMQGPPCEVAKSHYEGSPLPAPF